MQAIAHGRTADVYAYDEGKILKLYLEGFPEEAVRTEFEVNRYAYGAGLPTAQPFVMLEKQGRLGTVFTRLQGQSLLHRMLIEPERTPEYCKIMAGLHARINATAVTGGVPKQHDILHWKISHAALLSDSEKAAVLTLLSGLPQENKLCHGDYHPDNVMLDGEPAVVDWMSGTAGHPAADVTTTLLLLKYGSVPVGMEDSAAAALQQARGRIADIYLETYTAITGLKTDELSAWTVPVAAGRLADGIPLEEKQVLAALIRDLLP